MLLYLKAAKNKVILHLIDYSASHQTNLFSLSDVLDHTIYSDSLGAVRKDSSEAGEYRKGADLEAGLVGSHLLAH